MKWLSRSYWRYVLGGPYREQQGVARWRIALCRLRDHPHGPIYYNAGGLEPDGRCKDCLEFIA